MTVETGDITAINHLNPTPEFFGPNPDYWYGVYDYALGGPSGPRSTTSQPQITVAVLDDCNGQSPPAQGAQQTLNILDFAVKLMRTDLRVLELGGSLASL